MHSNTSYTEDKVFLANNLKLMEQHGRLALKNIVLLRKDAFRSAERIQNIINFHNQEMQADLQAAYPNKKDAIHLWIADQLRPYIEMGGDHFDVMEAVANNTSLKQFQLTGGPMTVPLGGKSKKKLTNTNASVEPPMPAEDLSPEEKVTSLKARLEFRDNQLAELREENRQLKDENRALRRENARMRREIKRLHVTRGSAELTPA